MDAEITIQKAGSEQLLDALKFVQASYQKRFGTKPSTIYEDCLVALAGEDFVGVIAMQFSEGQGFEVEDQFLFGFSTLVHPRTHFVSLSRWAAARPGIGIALMLSAMQYSLIRGRAMQLSCSKPNVLGFLRDRYQLRFDTLHVRLCEQKIHPEDRNFFMSRPPPCLCVSSAKRWYDCLKPQVDPAIRILI